MQAMAVEAVEGPEVMNGDGVRTSNSSDAHATTGRRKSFSDGLCGKTLKSRFDSLDKLVIEGLLFSLTRIPNVTRRGWYWSALGMAWRENIAWKQNHSWDRFSLSMLASISSPDRQKLDYGDAAVAGHFSRQNHNIECCFTRYYAFIHFFTHELGLLTTRVSEVLNLSRHTVGRARSEETRNFGELLLPLIHRDKRKEKQELLNQYFTTIKNAEDSTKSGMFLPQLNETAILIE